MRISSKGRYGLAAMVCMAQGYSKGEYITIISISEKLGISKIYLEQVFSLLKRAELVTSIKGAQGGYQLTRMPSKMMINEILNSIEISLFDKTESSVLKKAENIEVAMQTMVWEKIDVAVSDLLKGISLSDLLTEAEQYNNGNNMMFYI
jgi:Rrf2 family protein